MKNWIKYLVAFILGYLIYKVFSNGNGFSIGAGWMIGLTSKAPKDIPDTAFVETFKDRAEAQAELDRLKKEYPTEGYFTGQLIEVDEHNNPIINTPCPEGIPPSKIKQLCPKPKSDCANKPSSMQGPGGCGIPTQIIGADGVLHGFFNKISPDLQELISEHVPCRKFFGTKLCLNRNEQELLWRAYMEFNKLYGLHLRKITTNIAICVYVYIHKYNEFIAILKNITLSEQADVEFSAWHENVPPRGRWGAGLEAGINHRIITFEDILKIDGELSLHGAALGTWSPADTAGAVGAVGAVGAGAVGAIPDIYTLIVNITMFLIESCNDILLSSQLVLTCLDLWSVGSNPDDMIAFQLLNLPNKFLFIFITGTFKFISDYWPKGTIDYIDIDLENILKNMVSKILSINIIIDNNNTVQTLQNFFGLADYNTYNAHNNIDNFYSELRQHIVNLIFPNKRGDAAPALRTNVTILLVSILGAMTELFPNILEALQNPIFKNFFGLP